MPSMFFFVGVLVACLVFLGTRGAHGRADDEVLEESRMRSFIMQLLQRANNNSRKQRSTAIMNAAPPVDACGSHLSCGACVNTPQCKFCGLMRRNIYHAYVGVCVPDAFDCADPAVLPNLQPLLRAAPDMLHMTTFTEDNIYCPIYNEERAMDYFADKCDDCKKTWCHIDAYDPEGNTMHAEVCVVDRFCRHADKYAPMGQIKSYGFNRDTTKGPVVDCSSTPPPYPSETVDDQHDGEEGYPDRDDQAEDELCKSETTCEACSRQCQWCGMMRGIGLVGAVGACRSTKVDCTDPSMFPMLSPLVNNGDPLIKLVAVRPDSVGCSLASKAAVSIDLSAGTCEECNGGWCYLDGYHTDKSPLHGEVCSTKTFCDSAHQFAPTAQIKAHYANRNAAEGHVEQCV